MGGFDPIEVHGFGECGGGNGGGGGGKSLLEDCFAHDIENGEVAFCGQNIGVEDLDGEAFGGAILVNIDVLGVNDFLDVVWGNDGLDIGAGMGAVNGLHGITCQMWRRNGRIALGASNNFYGIIDGPHGWIHIGIGINSALNAV